MRRVIFPLAVLIVCVSASAPSFADTRSDVLERASHCASLPDGRLFLDCYYAAAQPERAALGLPPAPQAQQFQQVFVQPVPAMTALAAPAVPAAAASSESSSLGFFGMFSADKVPPEQFGLTNAKPGRGVNVDRIVERLSSYTFSNGQFTVTLANGQVWRQTDNSRANWRSTPGNYTATITNGALHTFNLRVQDGRYADDTLYKVERIH